MPAPPSGYLLIGVTTAGKLRTGGPCRRCYYDGGAVEIPYVPASHRFLFLRHTGTQVIYETAATSSGARTTLRTAALVTTNPAELTLRIQNNSGASVWDNINAKGTAVTADVVVDFATPRSGSAITALSFGSCISTFSGDGQNVNIIKGGTAGAAWKAKLRALGAVVWRIRWPGTAADPGRRPAVRGRTATPAPISRRSRTSAAYP